MTDFIARDLEGFELVNKITECKELFAKLKHKHGDEFCSNLPLDKNILSYLDNKSLKERKTTNKNKIYGKGCNNHGTRWTDTDKTILNDMFEKDKTVEEISEYLGRSKGSIEAVLVRDGLTDAILVDNHPVYIKKQDKNKKSWSTYLVSQLIEMFNQDIPTSEITIKLSGMSVFKSSPSTSENIQLTEDDVIDKLEQLGLVEVEDVIED